MSEMIFPPAPTAVLPTTQPEALFPLNRIFCVGRNYADHVAEMGNTLDRSAPIYFTKSLSALCLAGGQAAYPPGTDNYHHEVEFAVALHKGGADIAPDTALDHVWGYGVALDMTRRDHQARAKAKGQPWDTAKDVEYSAIVAPLAAKTEFGDIGAQTLWLDVNGARRQSGKLSDMIWSVPEIISHLSTLYRLAPGDLILTGTPAGVGAVARGDILTGGCDGLPCLKVKIV